MAELFIWGFYLLEMFNTHKLLSKTRRRWSDLRQRRSLPASQLSQLIPGMKDRRGAGSRRPRRWTQRYSKPITDQLWRPRLPPETRAQYLISRGLKGLQKLPGWVNIQSSAAHLLPLRDGMKDGAADVGFASPPRPLPGSEYLKGDELFKRRFNRC